MQGNPDPVDARPSAAMLVIGDEILSGRTRDANFHWLAGRLAAQGIRLREGRIIPDEHEAIVAAVNELRGRFDHVFTSGGIGPTHDDITADAVAAAFGVPIGVREDARRLLAEHYAANGVPLTEARLRMARIPEGATLIPNRVSAAPGFSLGNVHVMAGIPSVFRAMADWLLPRLGGGPALVERAFRLDRPEGDIATDLAAFAARWPALGVGSYPAHRQGRFGTTIVLRAPDAALVEAASADFCRAFPEARPDDEAPVPGAARP